MSSREIVLRLDERWYQALSHQLENETVEGKLNDYLDNLISLLPTHIRDRTKEEMRDERQRQRQEQEAAQKYAAFRVTEGGVTEHFQVRQVLDVLDSASYVRRWLWQPGRHPFREMLSGREKISPEEYDRIAAGCTAEDRKITGVYDVDLDTQEFSHVQPALGWTTYRLKDVSTASWNTYDTIEYDYERRHARFTERLAGKEISSAGHLSAREISFAEDICEMDGHRLNFYLKADFDVDAVFGTHVCTAENDDTLNVYADYDMATGQVCDTLEVNLHWADGREESLDYRLNAVEKAVLLRKMEAYCQEQTGQSLADYSAQRMAEDMASPAGPVM